MNNKPQAALRKRQQIANSAKSMFIVVAIASVLIGFSLVIGYHMVQRIAFTAKVNSERRTTLSTLETNLDSIDALKEEVQALQANDALNSIKSNPDDRAVQVILDALPADRNSDALGASLQQKLTQGVDGLSIEQLSVETVVDEAAETAVEAEVVDEATESAINTSTPAQPLQFTMVARGTADNLRQLLANFNKSIRVIDVTALKIQGSDTNEITMDISGVAYYQPAMRIELKDEVVKP
ncbi:hypothetical protein FJZ39_02070 [Candidatus Saccharibacteria bacterium]|nr:hypothetical protein [Candidatus Saccharibacteria bacterium]